MQETTRPQLHIAVCDDEALERQWIAELVNQTMMEEELSCRITSYESGTDLLFAIQHGAQFQILLLDVMMDGLDGMALAAALREKGDHTAIIFISSNLEMALRGYEVEALRYLAKPVDRERLREALLFCYRTRLAQKEILLPTASGQSRILPSDLIYAETWERGVRLILKDGREETGLKISELAAMLPERQFVFCHRTILVNLAFIQSIRYCELELKSGATLPISKYRQSEVRKQLMRYLEG